MANKNTLPHINGTLTRKIVCKIKCGHVRKRKSQQAGHEVMAGAARLAEICEMRVVEMSICDSRISGGFETTARSCMDRAWLSRRQDARQAVCSLAAASSSSHRTRSIILENKSCMSAAGCFLKSCTRGCVCDTVPVTAREVSRSAWASAVSSANFSGRISTPNSGGSDTINESVAKLQPAFRSTSAEFGCAALFLSAAKPVSGTGNLVNNAEANGTACIPLDEPDFSSANDFVPAGAPACIADAFKDGDRWLDTSVRREANLIPALQSNAADAELFNKFREF